MTCSAPIQGNKYLLLAEFSVRTVNYGPASRLGRKSMEKVRENEANKMFIIWLPVWGTGSKCRTHARFDSHLTGVKKEKFLLAHIKRFSVKVESNAPC